MTFSDRELDVLKRMCESADWPISGKELLPLIARLEAAELCARYLEAMSEGQRSPRENEALMAWRKAVGK